MPDNRMYLKHNSMDIPTFFMQRYEAVAQQFLPSLKERLSESDFRKRPAPGTQPIIWLIWHIARVEDQGLSRFVWNKPPLFDESWQNKMNIQETHYGTSMTDDQVLSFANRVNVEAVLEYQRLTSARTIKELHQFDLTLLDDVLDEATVTRIVKDEGLASEDAQWVIPHYVGKTKGWVLCHMGLTHSFRHFGQIMTVKKMIAMQKN